MNAIVPRPATAEPGRQAWRLLQIGYVVAPTLAGLDKFFELLTDWDRYLAPQLSGLVGGHAFMLVVGAVEIAAGLLVALKPRIGGWVVAAWLVGIIFNLVLLNVAVGGGYWDIALRDLGLAIGAVTLARLSAVYEGHPARDRARAPARTIDVGA